LAGFDRVGFGGAAVSGKRSIDDRRPDRKV